MKKQLKIVEKIKEYWSGKSTGALFFHLNDGKLLRLFFEKGEVQSAQYHGLSGIDIVRKIPEMKAMKYQFHENYSSRTIDHQLPLTTDIIAMISGDDVDSVAKSPKKNTKVSIGNYQKSVIHSALAQYVGPIAEIILMEELSKSQSMEQLISSLASQIDGINNQLKFKNYIREELNGGV